MGLRALDIKKEEPKISKWSLLLVISAAVIFTIISIVTVGVGAYMVLSNKTTPPEEPVVIEPTTTVSTSTTTSSIIPTTTVQASTSTTSTTTSTSTTIPCGGEFQDPCAGNKCDSGFTIGSTGKCHPLECAPSVNSGRGGCGAFALNYCKG